MKIAKFPAAAAVVLALTSGMLCAADTPSVSTNSDNTFQASQAVDEVLAMHKAGVDPGVIVGHLRAMPELPRLSAADIIELKENSVSPDVMSALILMTVPDKNRLSADDIVQLHAAGVPSDIITSMITKARKTTEKAAAATAQAAAKPNEKYLLAGRRNSSVMVIPHRTHYYSPYVRGNYYGDRYYGPSWSYPALGYGYGYGGYGRRYCW